MSLEEIPVQPSSADPKVTKKRVAWRSKITGEEGHGEWINPGEAYWDPDTIKQLNINHPEREHWCEYDDGDGDVYTKNEHLDDIKWYFYTQASIDAVTGKNATAAELRKMLKNTEIPDDDPSLVETYKISIKEALLNAHEKSRSPDASSSDILKEYEEQLRDDDAIISSIKSYRTTDGGFSGTEAVKPSSFPFFSKH